MRKAYLFYEAGEAVAAAQLGLKIRRISGNPALEPTHIVFPKDAPKARMIVWLTGLAAERKAVGKTDPLRRTRIRLRIRALVEAAALAPGPKARRQKEAHSLLNQAQDRANAFCANLYQAIEEVAELLRAADALDGPAVYHVLTRIKKLRKAAGQAIDPEDPPDSSPRPA